jgi:hypothetical protein
MMKRGDRRANLTLPGEKILVSQTGPPLDSILRDASQEASKVFRERVRVDLIPRKEFLRLKFAKEIVKKTLTSLGMLRQIWPALYKEVVTVIDQISFIRGPRVVAGTDDQVLGHVYLNPTPEWEVLTFLDHIVHEAGHTSLFLIDKLEPALANPEGGMFPSPIRRDPRPLGGILQSTFVACRLALLFDRVVKRDPSEDSLSRLHYHLRGLYRGMTILKRYGRFTRIGQLLFSQMQQETRRFQKTIPRPDPRLYQKIGKDYLLQN